MKPIYFLLIIALGFSCSEKSESEDLNWKEVTIEKPIGATKIEIFGEQFKWTVRYAGEDNILGKFDYKLINERNPLGLMTLKSIAYSLVEYEEKSKNMAEMSLTEEVTEEFIEEQGRVEKILRLLDQMYDKHLAYIDASAENDFIVEDTLVLCVDQEYEFHFRSKDVIHSANFPEFRAQMNTVPGMTTRFKFTPKETTEQRRLKLKDDQFDFSLSCNKICGAGHSSMKMPVRVVDKTEYSTWIKAQSKRVFGNLEPYSVLKN